MRNSRAHNADRGFSLLELIVVLVVLGIFLGMVVPMFRSSLASMRGDSAVREFISLLKYAQERAVSDGVEYRFYLNHQEGTYWVARQTNDLSKEDTFTTLQETVKGKRWLPDGISLRRPEAQRDRKAKAHFVAFYPNGACDYATLKLRKETARFRKDTITVSTKGRLGQLKVEGT
jgi:type II secretion system protein H